MFLLSQRMTASQWEIIWLRRMREYKIILSPKELTREHTENTVASSQQQQLVTMSPPTLVSPVTYCLYSSSLQTCLSVSSHMCTQGSMLSLNSTAFNCASHSCSQLGQSLSLCTHYLYSASSLGRPLSGFSILFT